MVWIFQRFSEAIFHWLFSYLLLEGAKDFIKKNKQPQENYALIENLQKLKSFLNELKANL